MLLISKVKGKAFRMFDLKERNRKEAKEWAIALGLISLMFATNAWCPDLGLLERELSTKIGQVARVMRITAGAAGGVGISYFVFTCFRGEPSYRLAGFIVVGASVLAVASRLAGWIATNN